MSQRLVQELQPVIEGLGYELWHLELVGSGSNRTLRVYIDGPDGVELADCEAVSREASAALDVSDPLSGEYRLEVSSPGLDRPLISGEHFLRFVGSTATVRMYKPVDGHRRFTGVIRGMADDELRLDCDGEEFRLPYSAIAKARLVPEFE